MDEMKRIADLEKELADLKAKKAKFDALPEPVKLAELLHSKFCHDNHTDMCDWFYGSWEDNPFRFSRQNELNKADKLLKRFSFEDVTDFLDLI